MTLLTFTPIVHEWMPAREDDMIDSIDANAQKLEAMRR
jgi:hypothetical protein